MLPRLPIFFLLVRCVPLMFIADDIIVHFRVRLVIISSRVSFLLPLPHPQKKMR